MTLMVRAGRLLGIFLLGLIAAGCGQGVPEDSVTDPTATPDNPVATVAPIPTRDRDFIVIATDAPLPPFTQFDEFGNVEGFDNSVMGSDCLDCRI